MRGATRKRSRPDRESIQSMLSQHFQPASDRDRVNPAESAFWYHGKCCDDDLGLQTRVRRAFPASARWLRARINTKIGYGSAKATIRSPLSPTLATESATVRLFFILSVLLCSVNKAGLKTETWFLYCLLLRSRSLHNA